MSAGKHDEEMRRRRLVFYEDDIETIDACLDEFLQESKASAVLLIDVEGHLVTRKGYTQSLDTTAIAALVAGSYASTKALAQNLGEKEFAVIFHQGENENMHISLVAERCLIVIIFDDRTTIGMVRLHAAEVSKKITEALEDLGQKKRGPNPVGDSGFVQEAETKLDDFFGTE